MPSWKIQWYLLITGSIITQHFDGLVQEKRNSSALAMELRLSCTNPWNWYKCDNKPSWGNCGVSFYTPCTTKLWGAILVSLHPSIHLSICLSIHHAYCLLSVWLVAYFMDYIPMWHKYNPWGDNVLCTISRSIGERSRSHGSIKLLRSGLGLSW